MTYPDEPRHHSAGRRHLRREIEAGFRRAMGLTMLGTVVPGAGLTQTRHKKMGWVLIVAALGGAALLGYVVLTRGLMNTALSLVSSPSALQMVSIGLLVGGAIWAASIILTAVSSRPDRLDHPRTRTLAALTTLMVLVVAGTSYKAAEYALITKDTLLDVFPSSALKPGQGAKVDIAAKDPWAETPRVNILLLGSDAGVGRSGTRTDSMIVASIDTKTGRTALVSLPRNLMRAPIPESSPLRALYPESYGVPYCQRGQNECMLNAIWAEADEYKKAHPEAYPGEASAGRYEIRQVIGEILDVKIDHTVIIDLKGFQQLIDAMGGVEVNVRGGGPDGSRPLPYGKKLRNGKYTYTFQPGVQRLDGYHALWYARTRAADDDFYRQARQRCVVKAVVSQVNPASMLAKYADVARIAKDNIYTDIPAPNLPAFVQLIERVQKSKIVSVALTQKQGVDSMDPDFDVIRGLLRKAIAPPAPATPKPSPTSTPDESATPTGGPSDQATPTGTPTTAAADPDQC
jgi:LCP family protein required for cell wall assembly